MIFVGIDWAEAHHDACIVDERGEVLAKQRVPDGVEGVGRLHAMIADHVEEPSDVVIGIEIDRGLLVETLVSASYEVYAINPMAASRYRDRHATSRAKSDPGDAKVLADLVAPTDTTTARSPATPKPARRSRFWLAHIRI